MTEGDTMNPKINELGFPEAVTGDIIRSDQTYMAMNKYDLVECLRCAQNNYEVVTETAINIKNVAESLADILEKNNIKIDWLKLGVDEQNGTVDAVEVVRCKDCEFAHREDKEVPWFSCHNETDGHSA